MKKRVFKLFWAWQDDKENKWLEKMAEEGWELLKYNLMVYTFEKIEPKNTFIGLTLNRIKRVTFKNTLLYLKMQDGTM